MFKNNLKTTILVLKRKKLFSAITILGIAVPLMFLMIIISTISHIAAYESPQSNFDRVLFFDQKKASIKRTNMSGTMGGGPTYDFVKKYVKPMKTPEKVGVVSRRQHYNMYQNNQKTKLKIVYTDGEFWDIADFKFTEGKAFNIFDVDNAQQVAVIDEFTRNLVFGDENAIGKSINFFRDNYKIIGVVKNVDVIRRSTHANVYLPITTSETYSKKDIFGNGIYCLLLANSNEQFSQIESEFNHIIENFQLTDYDGLTKIEGELRIDSFIITLENLFQELFSIRISADRIIYFAYAVIFLFFILLPSINLLYIHISRINERSSEIGVRKSFGGNKSTLSKQFVSENLIITIFSGVLGLIFTLLFCFILNRSNVIPGLHLTLNVNSLLLILILWIFFGVITGILPALRMSRIKIIDALHQHDSHQYFDFIVWKAKRLKMLLVFEFIITFIALAIIGTFVFRFQKNNSYPTGFDVDNVYHVSVVQYDMEGGYFGHPGFEKEIIELIKSKSFIESYGEWTWNEPYHDGYTTFSGKETVGDIELESIHITHTGINMDKVFNLNLIEGRWFDKTDDIPDYNPIVINQLLKENLFNDEKAIGENIQVRETNLKVIGVIDHYRYHGEFSKPVDILFYTNSYNKLSINCWGKQRTDFFRVKPGTTVEQINNLATRISQNYPDYEIEITPLKTDRSKYFRKIWGPVVAIFIVFSFVLFIVLLGLFGVLWYNISLRKIEIGLRRAVGATSNKIFIQVIREMLSWASIGILIGVLILVQIPLLKLFPVETDVFIASVISAALIIYLLIIFCSIIPGIQAAKTE
ncbi:MAG: ABC transporter permease, partial [Bacteroidales bacterium]|nr:ABC transporter permease [Bacteroidales bacterium]